MKKMIVFVTLGAALIGQAQELSMEQYLMNDALVKIGEKTYGNYCKGCHGVNGDASTASTLLYPKPRNFTSATFKFRSTANGELPTDQDLIRTISQGVIGTSMPAFPLLGATELLGLAKYIQTFSPAWKDRNPAGRVSLPTPVLPAFFAQKTSFLKAAEKGKEVYKTSCMMCHGHAGKGDGPSAEGQTDEWDQPIVPADLTKSYIKSGYGAEDIYRVLQTGLNGAPMPAYVDSIGADAAWNVTAYVMYLRGEAAGLYAKETIPAIPAPKKDVAQVQ